MKYQLGKIVVIKLGGSIVYPEQIDPVRSPTRPVRDKISNGVNKRIGRRLGHLTPLETKFLTGLTSNGIDVSFLKSFRSLILNQIRRHKRRFCIVVGGGKICRVYQDAAAEICRITDEDKDWIGIHASRTNGHLLRTIFREEANPVVIDARGKVKSLKYPVTIAAGWKPGNSTDYVALALAADFHVSEAIVMGHPDYVYDKDPRKFSDAVPYEKMRWKEYRKFVPAKWIPGASAPVDPVAARLAEKARVKVIVVGSDLKNLWNLLEGREVKGTIIS